MKPKLAKALKFIRGNLFSLSCGLVALLAVVFAFWPTSGWYTDLQAKVTTSAGPAAQEATLLNNSRHLPNVSIDNATPASLDFFPTRDVIKRGEDAVKQVGDFSRQMLDAAVQLNTHIPLVDAALPNGTDIARAQFGSAYVAALTNDSRIRTWPPSGFPSAIPIPPLKAGQKVSEEKKLADEEKRRAEINKQYYILDANGQPTPDSKTQADNVYNDEIRTIPLQLELAAAKNCKVYIEPLAITPPTVFNDFKSAVASLPTGSIWTAQLCLWIDEDVATAIARINADAADVTTSPVKQITHLEVKDPPYLISGDPTAGSDTTALTAAPDQSPSGRVSNGMYDVIWFKVGLDIDATQEDAVLNGIEAGQFITILSYQAQTVDSADEANKGWVYGKAPVIHLDLTCEELMLHQWTSKLQPADGGAAKYVNAAAPQPAAASNFMNITVHSAGQ
jgi:hypothetical protein